MYNLRRRSFSQSPIHVGYVDSINILRDRILLLTYQGSDIKTYSGGTFVIDLKAPAGAGITGSRRLLPEVTLSGRMTDVSNHALEILSDTCFVFQRTKDLELVMIGENPEPESKLFRGSKDEQISPMCGIM